MARIFSEYEKRIIHSLLDLDKSNSLNVLGNIIEKYLCDYFYIKVVSDTDVSLMIKEDSFPNLDINKEYDKISEFLLTVITLFEYLESEKLVYFIGQFNLDTLGEVFVDEKYIKTDFIDAELTKPIHRYTTKRFYITESLKNLVQNNFKTSTEIYNETDIKFKNKELCYTRLALIITFVGLLASIFIPLLSTTSVHLDNSVIQTSLNDKQLGIITQNSTEELSKLKDIIINTKQFIEQLQIKTDSLSIGSELTVLKNDLNSIELKVEKLSYRLHKIENK